MVPCDWGGKPKKKTGKSKKKDRIFLEVRVTEISLSARRLFSRLKERERVEAGVTMAAAAPAATRNIVVYYNSAYQSSLK